MSRHTKKHRSMEVLALDASYMPMAEITRRRALKAVASGRAQVLNPKTWTTITLLEAVGKPIHAIVFPKAKAVSEVKFLDTLRPGLLTLCTDCLNCDWAKGWVRQMKRGTNLAPSTIRHRAATNGGSAASPYGPGR